jgi:hypothetical protein
LQSTDISRAPADLLRTAAAGFSGCRDSDFFSQTWMNQIICETLRKKQTP